MACTLVAFGWVADRALDGQILRARREAEEAATEAARLGARSIAAALGSVEQGVLARQARAATSSLSGWRCPPTFGCRSRGRSRTGGGAGPRWRSSFRRLGAARAGCRRRCWRGWRSGTPPACPSPVGGRPLTTWRRGCSPGACPSTPTTCPSSRARSAWGPIRESPCCANDSCRLRLLPSCLRLPRFGARAGAPSWRAGRSPARSACAMR